MAKVRAIIGSIFLGVGIITLMSYFWISNENDRFLKSAEKTPATIIDINSVYDSADDDYEHEVIVKYEVDGREYSGRLDRYSSNMHIGDEVTIYYNRANPSYFRSDQSDIFWIFFLFSGIFSVIGGGLLISYIISKRKKKKIENYHFMIRAHIEEVNYDTSISYNGRHPYRVYASYTNSADNKLYTYVSEPIFQNIRPLIEGNKITTVPVYVDPNNYAHYIVDLSEIKHYLGN